MAGKKELRQQAIVERLTALQTVSVDDLCEAFGVSEATIHRDLSDLDAQRRLHRVFGGARTIDNYVAEPPVLDRLDELRKEKTRIAQAAAELVVDGDVIFLSSGTTTLHMVPFLSSVSNLTVITNSLPVINRATALEPKVNLIAIGGVYRETEQSFLGKMAIRELHALRANKLFIGVRAIHPVHGLMNDNLNETEVDMEIIRMAESVIILADHTKFGLLAPVSLADFSQVEAVITDAGLSDEVRERFSGIADKLLIV